MNEIYAKDETIYKSINKPCKAIGYSTTNWCKYLNNLKNSKKIKNKLVQPKECSSNNLFLIYNKI